MKFEKENIWSLDNKGEFVLTLMASFAQEEARSLSENTSWGIRKRMADGKYWVAYSRFLGYDKDFVIEDEGAYTVKLIFKAFLAGYSAYRIKQMLDRNAFKTPYGYEIWQISVIQSILQNEKYKGDALLQKEYITDFITKKRAKNKGELPQYYVTGGHEPVVYPPLFDYVQEIFAERNQYRYSGLSLMSSKLLCGKRGTIYGRTVGHPRTKYQKEYWICRNKYNKNALCDSRRIQESTLKYLRTMTYIETLKKHLAVKDTDLPLPSSVVI